MFATSITLDYQQLSAYEQVARGSGFLPNARPVQPLDGRRLNEIDHDVNFQDQPIDGLNFGPLPGPAPGRYRYDRPHAGGHRPVVR